MGLIRTDVTPPVVRILTDDGKLVIVRRSGDDVVVHIECIYRDEVEACARIRKDQAKVLIKALLGE